MDDKLKNWLKTLKLNEATISMVLGGLVVVAVGVLILNYFNSVDKGVDKIDEVLTEEKEPAPVVNLPTQHKVTAGEHLWSIAEKYYGSGYNWTAIVKANNLSNGNYLKVGQVLKIPKVAAVKTNKRAVKTTEALNGSTYTVKKGDTLWKIAVAAYQDGYKWTRIAQANKDKLVNPNLVEVGMTLKLPR